ncbi:MAG TPA: hypothetical protein VGK48_19245 [Terriglobia bacterium]|jgi:hypothetical protein
MNHAETADDIVLGGAKGRAIAPAYPYNLASLSGLTRLAIDESHLKGTPSLAHGIHLLPDRLLEMRDETGKHFER